MERTSPETRPSGRRRRPDRGTLLEWSLVGLGLLCFGVLFFQTWERQVQPTILALGPAGEGTTEHWSGLYIEDQKIGYSVARSSPTRDGGLLLQDRSELRLFLIGEANQINLASDLTYNSEGSLREMLSQISTTIRGVPVSLRVEGEAQGKGMRLRVLQGNAELTTLDLDEVPATPASLYRTVLQQEPQVGDQLSVPLFSPLGLGHSQARVTVLGQEEATLPDGSTVLAWSLKVDHSGQVLEALVADDGTRLSEREVEGGLGMRVRLESAEDAVHHGWPEDAQEAVDLIALSSIPFDGLLPPGVRTLRHLDLVVDGPEQVSTLLRQHHGEAWDPATRVLAVRIPDPFEASSYTLPNTERSLKPWLQPTPFSPSDHPKIRRKAGEIIGDQLDALEAARKLTLWVYGSVEKVPVASVPSALEILESLRGDCNEHTTLFTALARSVGLPTRSIAGIVYSDSTFAEGAFYYHAWPEVWLGEGWVPVDPTFGQFPADATHVGLVEGGLDRQMEIMGVIGRLKLGLAPEDEE